MVDIMADLQMDYNVIYSQVKVYEKKYKRRDKNGNQIEATTIQNTILLPKKVPFKSNEDVVIMKEKTFQDLTKNSNINTSDLKSQLEAKEDTIKNLEDTIRDLKKEIMDHSKIEDDISTNLMNVIEDLRMANHKNQTLQQEMQEIAMDLARCNQKLENNKQLFNIINSYYETLLKQAIDTTIGATIVEINKELKETNFIQRLKGLKIVTPPAIDDKKIIDENVAKLTSIIDDDNLLE